MTLHQTNKAPNVYYGGFPHEVGWPAEPLDISQSWENEKSHFENGVQDIGWELKKKKKKKTAKVFFLCYISIVPKPLDFFYSCVVMTESWEFSVLGTREGRLPQLHICSYHVDQVLGSDWLQKLTPVQPKRSNSTFNLKLEYSPVFFFPSSTLNARSVDRGDKVFSYLLKWPYCGGKKIWKQWERNIFIFRDA